MNKDQREALKDVDILIDGPYIQELSDPYNLKWRRFSKSAPVCQTKRYMD